MKKSQNKKKIFKCCTCEECNGCGEHGQFEKSHTKCEDCIQLVPINIKELLNVQDAMGELGFTLTPQRTYYKDYSNKDGSVSRITPIFDTGMSYDQQYRLSTISITTVKHIPIVDNGNVEWKEFPSASVADISTIIAKLSSAGRQKIGNQYIISQECLKCKKVVPEFILVDKQSYCLSCMGYK